MKAYKITVSEKELEVILKGLEDSISDLSWGDHEDEVREIEELIVELTQIKEG